MKPEETADAIARGILKQLGEDIESATRPGIGESNLVWITPEVVLRMSAKPGLNPYLEREAALIPHLPSAVGHPELVASGTDGGRTWLVTSRLPGSNLYLSWDSLELGQRIEAMEELWTRLVALQETDVEVARAAGAVSAPMYALSPAEAKSLLADLVGADLVDDELRRLLEPTLEDLFGLMAEVPWRLNHTDPGAHNAVYDGRRAIPVDLEFATLAPVDLDLDALLSHLYRPEDQPVAERLLQLASQHRDRPGGPRRLLGYRILKRLWAVRVWRDHAIIRDRDRPSGSWPPRDSQEWPPLAELPVLIDRYRASAD